MTGKNRRGGLATAAVAAILVAAGGVAIGVGVTRPGPPPQPAEVVASATASPTPSESAASDSDGPPVPAGTTPPAQAQPAAPAQAQPASLTLPESLPTRLTVPSIGVDTDLMQLGKNPDGTVEVPPLGVDSPAGWYRNSPTPGELGPSVLLGHVDAAAGPSVFYRLGELTAGAEVTVTREDGTTAVFAVDRTERYPKADFPTLEVYGNTDDSQLRLITCGGAFDRSIGHYVDNIVVYATLVSSRPA
ncbi:class F sortase [Planctomonas deserti]|uniref:class F sortase n=1 Tax=Planctomonas deserti TaxID=2144185 RepID=UPI000D3BA534|nr:class F sortase [Planctomonas deserti]